MFSGYLQIAANNGLNGKGNMAGWRYVRLCAFAQISLTPARWLFVINGIISLPLALLAFLFLPDDPARTRVFVFTQAELELAQNRNEVAGRAKASPWTWRKAWAIFRSWQALAFIFYSTMSIVRSPPPLACDVQAHDTQIPFQVQSSLIFWLKKQPKIYSLTQVNAIPTLTNGVVAIFLLFFGWLSDGPFKGRRWPIIIFVHVS